MYNPENVRKIKICIRAVLISLVIVPSILMVSVFAKSAQLQEQMENLSQKLRETETQLELEQSLAQEDPDFAVTKAQVKNGGRGEPLSDLYPDMIVEWREDPVRVQEEPTVYLTFDDGPKKDTPELLETLSELDVPATFFLVGLSVRAFPEYAKQIVQAGYAVGSHTMAHSIGRIQKDAEFVLRDLARFEKTMREEVDETFSTDLFRFPGGSTAYKSRVKTLVRDAGYAWFDWNTMTGDAQYTFSSDQEMLDYTLRQTEGKDVIILLMHEGKARTRRILPELVAYFREAGYEFRALSTSEEDRGILSRCGAHMMLPDAAQD